MSGNGGSDRDSAWQKEDRYWKDALYYLQNKCYPSERMAEKDKKTIRRRAALILKFDDKGKIYVKGPNGLEVEVIHSPEERRQIIHEYHSSGHAGWENTWRRISKRFKWKGLSNDVKEKVAKCDVCQHQLSNNPTCTGPSSSAIGLPQQASASSEEHAKGYSNCVPLHVPPGDTGHCDSPYEEASGRQCGIEYETGAGNSQLALSVDRHVTCPLTVKMQPPYMTGPCGSANPTEPKMFIEPEQATDAMEVDSQYGMMRTFCDIDGRTLPPLKTTPIGGENMLGNLLGNDLINPQMERVQTLDSFSAQERYATRTLHLGSGSFQPPAVPMQQPYMPGVYGNDSMSMGYSGSPCTSDRYNPTVTTITPHVTEDIITSEDRNLIHGPLTQPMDCTDSLPMAKDPTVHVDGPDIQDDGRTTSTHSTVQLFVLPTRSTCYFIKEIQNDRCYIAALQHANALSDPEEDSLLIHGQLAQREDLTNLLPEAKIVKPKAQCDTSRSERVTVQYKLPPYCVPMNEYIMLENYLEENGGYYCMESVMRVVRKLEYLHIKLLSGHGAFSDISSIIICKTHRSGHLVTFLIPKIDKLAKAMNDVVPGAHCTLVLGMVYDITSLGDILRELLPLLQDRRIHVSRKMLENFKAAADLCGRALEMAEIAHALNVKKRLCSLHIKFPPHCRHPILDIVCYEGENIYDVINSAWLNDGRTVESYGCELYYDDSLGLLPVVKDDGVTFPMCNTHIVPILHHPLTSCPCVQQPTHGL